MKATAKAPANIAFIKYWGKSNDKLRLPMNSSISMNLSGVYTITSVEFDGKLKKDSIKIDDKLVVDQEMDRMVKHLDRVRKLAGIELKAKVESKNNFPKGTGIASSASGFAALTVAATKAAGLNLSEKKLSVLARLGSGSACRSIPDGFVEWRKGSASETSYAHSLHSSDYWSICDVIAIVGEKAKKVGSSTGHKLANTSPFFESRLQGIDNQISKIKKSIRAKNFTNLGTIIEAESINMHAVMMTSKPPLFYWLPETIQVIEALGNWREKDLETYFTIDAGPNVHVICKSKDASKVSGRLKRMPGVKKVIVNKPAFGARLVS